MSNKLLHGDVTEAIIGAAMRVLSVIGPGLLERLYERALVIELRKLGYQVDQQRSFDVYYDNQHIGSLIPDLLVEQRVIVEAKSAVDFTNHDVAQLLSYLNITGCKVGLLMNFQKATLRWQRIVN